MKKRIATLLAALVLLAGAVPAFESSAAADVACHAEPAGAGRLSLSGIGTDVAYRLVLPDGMKTIWSVRGEYDADSAVLEPLDGGDYYLETCSVDALTVVDAESDYLPGKYDLWSEVPAGEIQISEKIVVAQPEDEGDNVVDLAEGEVLLSSSYNEYAVFAKENNFYDSDFDYSAITRAPAVRYVSADDGATWKKLTGDVTITSSAADFVENGVDYALYCGDSVTTITLDNVRTTGRIFSAPFGETIVKIKGDVHMGGMDTEYFGKLTVMGADDSAKLTASRALLSTSMEIRGLAELNMECRNIAINCFMGDLKLTDIRKLDIVITEPEYASCVRSYDGNVIFTDVLGTLAFSSDPNGKVVEVEDGNRFIINTDGACVYAGADSENLQPVTLLTEGAGDEMITGIFPAEQMSSCLAIVSEGAAQE